MMKSRKKRISKDVSPCPMPVMLLGSRASERTNFMAASWVMRVNASPPMLAVAVHGAHLTCELIGESGCFSLNLPSEALLEKIDYCGLYSGKKYDKSKLFTLFDGEETTAPLIEECPLNIELTLDDAVELPTNLLFIGEVLAVYCDEKCLHNGEPDSTKLMPVSLSMPDNKYWALGDFLGHAWQMGRKYRGDMSCPVTHAKKSKADE